MDADLDTRATALYVKTDDLLKAFPERAPARPKVPDRAEARRGTIGHIGGHAGAAGVYQRDPVAAVRP